MNELMPRPANDHVRDTIRLLEQERAAAAEATPYRSERNAADKCISELSSRAAILKSWPAKKPGCFPTIVLSVVVWYVCFEVWYGVPTINNWFAASQGGENGPLCNWIATFLSVGSIFYVPIAVRWALGYPERKRADERGKEAFFVIPEQIKQQQQLRAAADVQIIQLYVASGSSLAIDYWDVAVIDEMIRLTSEMQLPSLAAVIAEYGRRQEAQQLRAQAEAAEQRRQEETQQILDGQKDLSRQLWLTELALMLQNNNRR